MKFHASASQVLFNILLHISFKRAKNHESYYKFNLSYFTFSFTMLALFSILYRTSRRYYMLCYIF